MNTIPKRRYILMLYLSFRNIVNDFVFPPKCSKDKINSKFPAYYGFFFVLHINFPFKYSLEWQEFSKEYRNVIYLFKKLSFRI